MIKVLVFLSMVICMAILFMACSEREADPSSEDAAAVDESMTIRPVSASEYKPGDIGEACWNSEHNNDLLTIADDGRTVFWDSSKEPKGKYTPSWVPASSLLKLHSGEFSMDYEIEDMGEGQVGVGFMIQLTDGKQKGGDWGFFGYLGSSGSAWAYDPSTGDVVSATKSIEGGLPKFTNGNSGTVQLKLSLPRDGAGEAKFVVDGTESKPISLPAAAVVLPAACLLKPGQRVTIGNFSQMPADKPKQ